MRTRAPRSLGSILYLNVPRLRANRLASSVNIPVGPWDSIGYLHQLEMGIHTAVSAFDPLVRALCGTATQLADVTDVSAISTGRILIFNEATRTRDVPGLDDMMHGTWQQKPGQEPCVYTVNTNPRLVVCVQPRWITFSSAFVRFHEGSTKLAGLAEVTSVDVTRDEVQASGLAVALPY